MYMPLVSIIIPVYNGSNFLKQAIDSALAQTYPNTEVIVVNDGSNDNGETEKIALSYGCRIQYYYKRNGGVSSALNFGISRMHGEWFSWLSHDDLYRKNKISNQVKTAEAVKMRHKKFIVLCNFDLINEEGHVIPRRKYPLHGELPGREMFVCHAKGYVLNGCAMLIPKCVFLENGLFNESLHYIQDVEYWSRLMLNGYYFIINDSCDVEMRVHPNQVTVKETEKYFIEMKQVSIPLFDKLFKNFDYNNNLLKNFLYMMIKFRQNDISEHMIKQMRLHNLLTPNIQIKILYYRFLSHIRSHVKALYYAICAHSAR